MDAQTGKEYKDSLPDDESYDLIVGYVVNECIFLRCVQSCVNNGRLDTLVSIIRDARKWIRTNLYALLGTYAIAMQSDKNKLTYYALEFMAKWIARGENASPAVLLSLDEGLVVSAPRTVCRTYLGSQGLVTPKEGS
ncbi:UNVERIFIED_CONTAM: Pentatricopeptide repeat-containing protein, mitochondrial [Sesamum radiatum]|uniref:Pentatricopeptide repeat-containing protein, mitochondrial n=1 Tax=Sesamum radiatum TaxID=300843 RepID=A0AAW2IZA5_SESRA